MHGTIDPHTCVATMAGWPGPAAASSRHLYLVKHCDALTLSPESELSAMLDESNTCSNLVRARENM